MKGKGPCFFHTLGNLLHRVRTPEVFALAAVLALPAGALALGVRIPNQDPVAIARGNAFVATADNPSAIYYNPAGITQLQGHNLQAGTLAYLNVYTDYQSASGARTSNDPEIIPVPQLHYVFAPEGSPCAFGLGVYAPFGLAMKWPDNAPFATSALEARLTYATVNPVFAVKLHPTLSVAIGPTFNYSELKLRQAIGLRPGDEFTFKGDSVGYGYNLGLLWQPHDQWAVGLTYRSGVGIHYDGTATLRAPRLFNRSFDSSIPLDFPQIITGGVSFHPTTNWNVEADVDWTDWDVVDRLAVRGVTTRPLDWKASFFYEFGVTRQLAKGYFASAGYFYSQQSTSERYFIPTVPDTDLHVGSLGVGFKGKQWQWAIAGQIIAGPWRRINDNVNPTVNGRYRLFTPTLSVSAGYHF